MALLPYLTWPRFTGQVAIPKSTPRNEDDAHHSHALTTTYEDPLASYWLMDMVMAGLPA